MRGAGESERLAAKKESPNPWGDEEAELAVRIQHLLARRNLNLETTDNFYLRVLLTVK